MTKRNEMVSKNIFSKIIKNFFKSKNIKKLSNAKGLKQIC